MFQNYLTYLIYHIANLKDKIYLWCWNNIIGASRMKIEEVGALESEVLYHNDTKCTFCSVCP